MADPIRFEPLNDGSEEGYQCARCGSSVVWFDCDNCGGVGAYDTNYVDDEWDDPYQRCPDCSGNGGWNLCASSAEYCNAHPIAGREDVPRGKIEWFTRPPRSPSPDTRDKSDCAANACSVSTDSPFPIRRIELKDD